MPRRENWAAFNFHHTHGPEFEKIDSDEGDVYEMVVKRRENILLVQSVFKIFPGLNEWTKYLFQRQGEGIWVFQGRNDDVINVNCWGKSIRSLWKVNCRVYRVWLGRLSLGLGG